MTERQSFAAAQTPAETAITGMTGVRLRAGGVGGELSGAPLPRPLITGEARHA